ncbi:MAG: DUF3067 family protein [Cyanophyceae cyanobacterium]
MAAQGRRVIFRDWGQGAVDRFKGEVTGMTGEELHRLLVEKWGYSFDVQIKRVKDKLFLQVMWRYLEQVSFPLSEAEYFEHLDAITTYLRGWGATDQVRSFLQETRQKPRLGKAVNIPIDLGERASEWLLDFP